MLTLTAQATAAQQLKDHTKKEHQAVEALLIPIIKNIHATAGYAHLLKIFYGFFQPLESVIERFIDASVVPDIADRRKASFLLDDLHAMHAATNGIPLATDLPVIHNAATAMGALYVLEGSTLGGPVIAKMLQRQVPGPVPFHFFAGYGKATGTHWQMFVQAMNAFTTNEAQLHQMITAANQTFLLFKIWIESQTND